MVFFGCCSLADRRRGFDNSPTGKRGHSDDESDDDARAKKKKAAFSSKPTSKKVK